MEERLNALKTDFISIIELRESNLHIFETLNNRINILKQNYKDFINSYKDTLFVFTLDSFHFQGKLIDIEYEEMTRIYDAITNKMYCEYYKLYKIVVDYVNENIKDDKILNVIQANNQYPVYKDLEPYKQYEFHFIKELHETVLVILTGVNGFLMNKEHDLKIYQDKKQIGFNIDNFVNTLNFNNLIMKEKIQLFINYIEFFHKMHKKYLSRFSTKMQLMLSQINYDINFEGNAKNKQVANKQVLKTLKKDIGIENRELLTEVRHTITDEDTDTTTDVNDTPLASEKTAVYIFEREPSPVNDENIVEGPLTKEPSEVPTEQFVEEPTEDTTEVPIEQFVEDPTTEDTTEESTEDTTEVIEVIEEQIKLVNEVKFIENTEPYNLRI
jgi:hypothetical protein